MTTTDHRVPAPTTAAPLRVGRTLAGELAWYGLVWLGIVVGVLVVGNLGTEVLGDGVDRSVGWSALALPRYVLLGGGVVVVVTHLPLHVGLGVTRRDFLAGALPGLAVVAVAAAVVATVVLALEGVVYGALDWPHVVPARDGGERMVDADLPTAAVSLAAVYVLNAVSGLLGAAGFMRGGWILGALFIPVAAVPAMAGEVLIGGEGPGRLLTDWAGIDPPALPVVAGVGLVVAVASAALGALLLRRVPLDAGDVGWWR